MNSPLHIGASWYPELWPEEEWPRDLARMNELGFTIVRVFEFAWHRFEPAEGAYDFDWAVRLLDLCHAHGIRAMVGTPTAAPPAWLTARDPEVLAVRADGRRERHGRRRHYNPHSRAYREHGARIVGAMAARLGRHPAVHSWQIDNEMSGFDYGPETERLFHAWLERRYGTVAALNAAWGLEFWSQAYSAFDQVPLCTAAVGSIEVPERNHPSLILAIARFQNEGWSSFIAEQCATIRASSDAPITTNMVGFVGQMDWFAHNRALDTVGASMYADRRYYHYNLPRFDRMRAEKPGRPYWLLETAPNWSAGGRTWNIHYDERGVRLFTWLSTLLGGSMVLYWQWREHWAGQEMLHGTCVTASGKWRPNRGAWQQLADEFRAHGEWLQAHPPAPARLAVVASPQAAWALSIDPTDEDMAYEKLFRDRVYMPLADAQLWRDIIDEDADFTPYRVVCLPFMPMVRRTTRERLAAWVHAGGTLILGPLTGTRTEEFTVPRPDEFDGLEALIGGTSALRFTVQWVEDQVQVDFGALGATRTRTLCEAYAPAEAEPLARYRGGYGDGLPAALDHACGKGRVITLGCMVDAALWVRIVGDACRDAGIEPVAVTDGRVVVVPRVDGDGRTAGYGLANLDGEPRTVALPLRGTDLFTGRPVGPAIVLEPYAVLLVEGTKLLRRNGAAC